MWPFKNRTKHQHAGRVLKVDHRLCVKEGFGPDHEFFYQNEPLTIAYYKCSCGKVWTTILHGHWTKDELN